LGFCTRAPDGDVGSAVAIELIAPSDVFLHIAVFIIFIAR
jgi:hypothetical protein